MNFPQHKCSLTLTHNEHHDYYESVTDWLEGRAGMGGEPEFKDAESRQRAIDTDEVWLLQWYPETPIGFYQVAAPTLEELLDFAAQCDDRG